MKSILPNAILPLVSALALSTSLLVGNVSSVSAQSQDNIKLNAGKSASKTNPIKNIKRSFAKLDLSDSQQQDMQSIFQQLVEDNSVYKGEKQALREQTRALMQLDVWDEALAQDIMTQKVEQSSGIRLNIAKARNQAFAVLNDEQQSAYLARLERRAEKPRKSSGKRKRMAKLLRLTEQQAADIQAIKQSAQQTKQSFDDKLASYRQAEQDIVYANSFDEDAWLALQASIAPTKVAVLVSKSASKYEVLNVLDEKQRKRLTRINEKKQRRKKAKPQTAS